MGETVPGLLFAVLMASVVGAQPIVATYPRTARAPTRWTIEPRAVLAIGGAEGTGPAEFTNVVGVARLSSGVIVVADGTSRELRAFDARGVFLKRWSRRGQGPGELPELDGISMEGDSLLAIDGRRGVHQFTPTGTWVRSLILPSVPGYIVNPVFGSLTSVDGVLRLRAGSSDALTSVRQDSAWFARVSLVDSTVRVLGAVPLGPTFSASPGARAIYQLGYGPGPLVVARAGRVCQAYTAQYRITCLDSLGEPRVIIARDIARRPVTDSARQAYRHVTSGRRSDGTSRFEGSLRAHRERVAAATVFAETYPLVSQLVLAQTGELWVRRYDTADGFSASDWRSNPGASAWAIYDARGRWVAECTLPARFAPADMGRDWVLGVSRDADDVEQVQLYRLKR